MIIITKRQEVTPMCFYNPNNLMTKGAKMSDSDKLLLFKEKLDSAAAVVIGAGSGLSTNAFYACINKGEAGCPDEIKDRSVCIDGDIGEVIQKLV